MTGSQARQIFLEYFKKHNHQIVRSSSLVPSDDPTLLFTNAGMVQFKRIFLGEEQRDYQRAVTSQKCVRAGGKHNDLENVGYTARHHTFFEMLGNFSFGDYFKEDALEFAWDLLTNGYRLPKEKLWVSVYLDDDETYNLWHQKIGIPESRIVRLGEKDNFWSMGDTGPCGPCSEIHIDRGKEFSCGQPDCKVGCDCDRYLEIWNLVFMQYNRDAKGIMTPLPKPSIDTGLGLERIASVIQNTPTNFETDLIFPIIQETEILAEKKYGESQKQDIAMKVIADHSRAAAFLIGDGVLPSNEGQGYVLRRIMRRAIRYGRNIGLHKPFLHKTAKVVFEIMQDTYPELKEAEAFINNVIKNEEIRFIETLDNGLKLLSNTLADMQAKGETRVPGQIIFKLYDTYGFPIDIVKDVVREQKMTVDEEGFLQNMAQQRAQSRSVSTFTKTGEAYKELSGLALKPVFVGYDQLNYKSKVLMLVKDGRKITQAGSGMQVEIITTETPFYGKSGGQVGDKGKIIGDNLEIIIIDTIKDPTGLIIHKGKILSGVINQNQQVNLQIDKAARSAVACNHTATHILHAVLRNVLGKHVKQAGSMVASDRLRFDFIHFSQIAPADLDKIEQMVNQKIRENIKVETVEMDAEEAFKTGATALFEEKYGDKVRVVSISNFSRELCGGTHTARTGDIGLFKIESEASVAAGVRRIEAFTGAAAVDHIQQISAIIRQTTFLLKETSETLPRRAKIMLETQKRLEKDIEKFKAQIAEIKAGDQNDEILEINGVKVLVKKVEIDDTAALRELADKLKDRLKSGIIILGSVAGNKVLLIAMVTKDLVKKYHAGKLVKQIAQVVGGGGGGRPDMAQAGGTRPENLDMALKKALELIKAL